MPSTEELKAYADTQANAYGIPSGFFRDLIDQESNWNPNAVSSAGAQGIAQLMPNTAPETNRFDPYASLSKAAELLRGYFDRFGSWELAAAAYNAGPAAVSKYGGVPPYSETQNYVQKLFGGSAGMDFGKAPEVTKILFWAAAALIAIIVIGSVSK